MIAVLVLGEVYSQSWAVFALFLLLPMDALSQTVMSSFFVHKPSAHLGLLRVIADINVAKGMLVPVGIVGLLLYTGTSSSELGTVAVAVALAFAWTIGWWRVGKVARAAARAMAIRER